MKHRRTAMLAVGALAVCAGFNTLGNDFAYDDFAIIVNNPAVTQADRAREIWMRDYWAAARGFDPDRDLLYRPLTVLSYRLNHSVGHLHPFGYHLVNVLLHALVSMLVAALAIRVIGGWFTGIIAGSVFAVMPIHTEAIANVVGRAELLVGLFTLIAMLLVSQPGRRLQPLIYVGVGAAALAGLLSKESGIAVIALAPIFAYAFGGRSRRRRVCAVVVATVGALLVYLPLRYAALDGRLIQSTVPSKVSNVLVDATIAERFWSAWQLFGLYVAKTFWPQTLCMDYSFNALPLADSPFQFQVILGLLFVIALATLTVQSWRRRRFAVSATCLAILFCYLPVSNTFFLIKTVFAERVWYVPSIFLAILIGAGLAAAGQFQCGGLRARRPDGQTDQQGVKTGLSTELDPRSRRLGKPVTAIVIVLVLSGLVRGWVRNREWRDNGTLFASAYDVHPDSTAIQFCYGEWLVEHNDLRGVKLLEHCVRVAPGVSDAQLALGRAYLRLGQPRRALTALQAAAMHLGDHPEVRALLDEATRQVAEPLRQEIERLQEAFNRTGEWSAFAAWTHALTDAGRIDDAIAGFVDAEKAFGNQGEFHRAYAVNLMLSGLRDQAIAAYRRSLELDSNQPDVQAELATALLDRRQEGDLLEAEILIESARRLDHENVKVMIVHAELLANTGRRAQAIAVYQKLIERLPIGEFRETIRTRLNTLQRE